MDEAKLTAECSICCNTFTRVKRAPISCKKCGLRACRECLQKYILNQESLTQVICMMPDCDCIWDRAFLAESLTQVFMRSVYPKRRGVLLFQHMLSRLPETMPYVERRQQCDILKRERKKLQATLDEFKEEARKMQNTIYRFGTKIYNLTHDTKKPEIADHNVFICPCPSAKCRGFLSSAWKCKVCQINVCSKCHAIKGHLLTLCPNNDENAVAIADHICSQQDLASVALIKKDTKRCPSCGVPIHKVAGCDQMWCTQCQVAFSWRTGRKINGVVHNPHFYQWQRENTNGNAPRVVGDVRCGGFPTYHQLRRRIWDRNNNVICDNKLTRICPHDPQGHSWTRYIMTLHRTFQHFEHVDMEKFAPRQIDDANRELRIDYVLGERDDQGMKQRLASLDKQKTRENDIYHVLQLMQTVAMERFIAFTNGPTLSNAKLCFNECNRVRQYCNNELKKISAIDGLIVPIIGKNFYTNNLRFTKKDVGW